VLQFYVLVGGTAILAASVGLVCSLINACRSIHEEWK